MVFGHVNWAKSWAAVLMVAAAGGQAAGQDRPAPRALAEEILKATRVKAGLCIHLGCGDGRLAAELSRGGLLVHGLAADRAGAEKAREFLRSQGLYGAVAVDYGPMSDLPYADNLANLVVVVDLPAMRKAGLTAGEILRVVCPGGVAWVGGSEVVKPRPTRMDEWTHRAHDAGGNCVSRDTAFGPMKGLRWIAGPVWPLGTGYQVSNGGMVAAGGRLFAVTLNDVANYKHLPQTRNKQWFLVARDAHNGLLLWRRRIRRDGGRDGQQLADALVAVGDTVYTALDDDVVALDAATGEALRTYVKSPGRLRLAVYQGVLFVARADAISAFDAKTAKRRWRHPAAVDGMLVADGAVFYASGGTARLTSLDIRTGRQRWRVDLGDIKGGKRQLLFCGGGAVVLVWRAGGKTDSDNGIAVFSVADGKRLWQLVYPTPRAHWAGGVFHAGGLIWIRKKDGTWEGLAPPTGKTTRRLKLKGGYCGGCTRDIATEEFLVSTRPLNLFSWSDGTRHDFRGGRHPCRSGVIVANGLLYTLPHGCKCVREAVRGFAAFAPAGHTPSAAPPPRLEKGPARSEISNLKSKISEDDWPTFRHDVHRTAATAAAAPAKLKLLWEATVSDQKPPPRPLGDDWRGRWTLGDRITAPVVAGGVVYVSLTDAHRVVAIGAADGKVRWTFTAGGRLDTPPTIHRGLCLFGSHDGSVYCLRAGDGKLLWRFRVAAADRRIVAFGQIESLAPVVGGVLVSDSLAYVVAGRTAAVDGGIVACALEPATGKLVWSRKLGGGQSDLLVREGAHIRLAGGGSAGTRFDPTTGKPLRGPSPAFRWDYGQKIQTLWGGPNRVLDRTWRVLSVNETASYWMRIKQSWGSCQGQVAVASADLKRAYVYAFKSVHWSKVRDPRTELGGRLLAQQADKTLWSVDVPPAFQIEAMALSRDVLFAAGPTDRFRRTPGALLWAVSTKDGTKIAEHKLPSPPVGDGIAVAAGKLFLTTTDGKLLCFGDGK